MKLFAAASLLLFAAAAPAQSLLVLSKHDHTLAIVNPQTLQVTARVPVGEDPHEVIASADGRTAYVSIYGGGSLHTIDVIDLVSAKALPPIELGPLRGPHGLTFVQDKLWFTAEGAKAFGRYDPATHAVDLILGTGQNRTHMIYVSPDSQTILTSNVGSGTISLWTQQPLHNPGPPPGGGPGGPPPPGAGAPPPPNMPRTEWSQTLIPVGHGSEGFDISPDSKEVWVANAQDGTVSVIDLPARKVVATLDIHAGANRLKITPDGRHVLLSAGPDLVVLDAHTRKVIKRLAIGHGSAGILIDPNGTRAFISFGPDNFVAILDLKTLTVTSHLNAGGEPDGLAWATKP